MGLISTLILNKIFTVNMYFYPNKIFLLYHLFSKSHFKSKLISEIYQLSIITNTVTAFYV